MLELHLLRMAITTCLLLGQGQLSGTSGTVIVKQCSLIFDNTPVTPPAAKPETFVWIGMKLEVGASLLVRKVAPNSIASRYNLLSGDQITKVEGQVVDSLQSLTAALADKQRPAVLVEVIRDGRSFEMLIARPQRKSPSPVIAATGKSKPSMPATIVASPASGRSLNLTTSTGTLVMASRQIVEDQPEQRAVSHTAVSAAYYDHDGKLISIACEGDLKTVRARLDELPRDLRGPAVIWLGSSGQE